MPPQLVAAILENIDSSLPDDDTFRFCHDSLSGLLTTEEVLQKLEVIMAKFPYLVPFLVKLDLKKLCR